MDVTFGMGIIKLIKEAMYELDRDELTMKEFVHKIKTDESFAKYGRTWAVYGKQWRRIEKRYGSSPTYKVGQIKNLVELIKENMIVED